MFGQVGQSLGHFSTTFLEGHVEGEGVADADGRRQTGAGWNSRFADCNALTSISSHLTATIFIAKRDSRYNSADRIESRSFSVRKYYTQ